MKISSRLGAVPLPAPQFLNGVFNPNVYICRRASMKPEINGDMSKPFWEAAPRTQPFSDIEGDIKPKPQKETWAKFLWDDENLYLGAVIYDDQIWAYMENRDDVVFHDNDFEFFLDRNGGTHSYFELEVNARNTLWDLFLSKPYRDGGVPYDGFDYKGIVSAVKINGELNNPNADNVFWSVEIMIPWKGIAKYGSASEPPKTGDYYRFNLSRVEWRAEVKDGKYQKKINPETGLPFPEDNWVYAPTGVVNIHYPELWAFLVFAGADGKTVFEIPETEKIKWELRKVYYAQRSHFVEHGVLEKDIKKLQTECRQDIVLEITASMFQAYAECGDLRISIAQDGYTWTEEIQHG